MRIHRNKILESAVFVMNLYAASKSVLEVEYFNEVGTGIGPTMEFFTLVSREFQRTDLGLWLASEKLTTTGLFFRPYARAPGSVLRYFTTLGQLLARSMIDDRVMDLPLSMPLYKLLLGEPLSDRDIEAVYPALAATLQKLEAVLAGLDSTVNGASIEDLTLDFTFPGLPDLELKPGGASIDVTRENLPEYVLLVKRMLVVDGIRAQVEALRSGISSVFDVSHLRAFNTAELDALVNGDKEQPFTMDMLREHVKCDHGFTQNSHAVKLLFEVLCEFTPAEQRDFVMFVTGAPRLPVGGLAALHPSLTIVRRPPSEGCVADETLPSVSTCFFFLKMPDFSSKEIMKKQIVTAMSEGQGNFHMS